jgi:hypothetical protein
MWNLGLKNNNQLIKILKNNMAWDCKRQTVLWGEPVGGGGEKVRDVGEYICMKIAY